MFALSDKRSAIKEVQKFLHVISDRVNTAVPRVAIDGIYGVETEDAVRVFQELYGLTDNYGKVDLITFNTLFELYRDAIVDMRTSDYLLTDIGFPVKVGSQSNDVLAIHLLILELENTYNDIGTVSKSTYFSESSKNATMNLQKIFRFPITGEIDAIFYKRMLAELEAIHRLNEVYE